MSNKELATTNTGYIVPAISDEVMTSITAELDGLPITLDKVKIPAGGGIVFEVPGDDPDSPDSEKEVVGVIVDHYPLNSYWTEKYNGQNIPPVCYSTDSHIGVGEPGGECAKCPYNKFGSDEDGQSKACKNAHRLYILRSGELYPVVITVPPTSLKSLSDYLAKRIVTKGLRSYGVVTKLTLKKATNSTGIAYSQVQFTMLEKLSSEAAETLRQFGESIKPITRHIDFMDAEESPAEQPPMVDPETVEIVEPLE
ncbi:MAG: hypothetical protein RR263_03925 [Oscillospiraceae bacterium]